MASVMCEHGRRLLNPNLARSTSFRKVGPIDRREGNGGRADPVPATVSLPRLCPADPLNGISFEPTSFHFFSPVRVEGKTHACLANSVDSRF